ncbi:MAG: hypothetical protein LUQ37_01455 [Methanoregulaceae archaeon]|jgi:hypothetical protein|nr:hypothetical protein [Methanoregulaceae archaeon]
MLNIEGKSAEAKIGKLLILVSVMLGLFVIIILGAIILLIRPTGALTGFGVMMMIPFWILISIFVLKILGIILGIVALYYTEKTNFPSQVSLL